MPHDTSGAIAFWANPTGLAIAIIVCLLAATFSRWFASSAPKEPKPCKSLTFRVDDIPNDDYDGFDQKLQSIAEQDPALHDVASTFSRRSLSRKDKTSFCATVSAMTDLSGKELCARLSQAGKSYRYSYSCDFSGITPLFEDEEGAAVDIIAVPGLGSHPLGSWKSLGGDEVWLRDFLPKDVPNIRVLLYGYNTTLPGSLSKQSIEDLGGILVEQLAAFRARDNTTRRPLIFIGHSLGGLLIKEALIRARKRDSGAVADISKACFALLFFGVPNLGLRNDQLRTLVQGQPNEALIHDLLVDNDSEPSTFLKRLGDQFAESCKGQYRVVSFFERILSPTIELDKDGKPRKTGTPSLLVTGKSATATGLVAVADEDNIPLNTDHSGLVKYVFKSQGNYTIVRMRIEECVKLAEQHVPRRFVDHSFDEEHSNVREACMRSLAFEEIDGRHDGIEGAADGTCQWLLEHEKLAEWIKHRRGLLWIKGKPGSGKSTLLKFALKQIPPLYDAQAVVVSFFFHGRGHELQRSLLGLFRSLLYQLLHLVPGALSDLVETFDYKCKTIGGPGKEWHWHLQTLRSFFRSSLLRILKRRPVLLFIDALDECGEEPAVKLIEYLTDLLSDVQQLNYSFGVLFSCRHYPIIEIKNGWTIVPEEENNEDIDTFVQQCFPTDQDSYIRSLITGRAQGVFMWARIVVNRVDRIKRRGEPKGRIEREIKRIPNELDALYDDLLRNTEDLAGTIRLMQWICFSTRPLTINELPWAMAIDPYNSNQTLDSCQQSDEFINPDDIEKRVTALSCGLAEIGPSTSARFVQFIHQSVKDYMVKQGLSRLNHTQRVGGSLAPNTNCLLGLIIINYFNMIMSSCPESFGKDYDTRFPFLGYATTSLLPHLKLSESGDTSSRDFLNALQWPSSALVDTFISAHKSITPSYRWGWLGYEPNLVHITAIFGLVNLLSEILLGDSEVSVDCKDKTGRTPLSWAAARGHEAIVKTLLATGKVDVESRDEYSRTPLLCAAEWGHEAVVKALLEIGKVDVEPRDRYDRTPLLYAAKWGHEAAVRTLLETGKVDVESRDSNSRTPLLCAAEGGYEAIVKTLLETGKVDVESRDNRSRTPLLHAAEGGHEAVVKTLLEAGKADVESRDSHSQTPLSWAASNGHEAVVKTLLEIGKADVECRDYYEQTPLLRAALKGKEAVVKTLLETGKADVESRDRHSQTPLSWAASNGHEAVVKTLLETGKADVESRDSHGQTPLLYAASNGHEAVVKILLETGEVDVESRDDDGATPLSWAAAKGHEAVAKTLLEIGKVDVESRDSHSQTPLSLAASNGHEAVVKMLLEIGKADIESRDDNGQTPLSWAVTKGYEAVVEILLATGKVDVESRDNYGRTPLLWAAIKGDEAILEALLETGIVDVESRDIEYGQTPLSWAARKGYKAVVEILLATGKVDVDSRDEYSQTPLSWAARKGYKAVVEILLATGKVDVESRDKYSLTPLLWAARHGHEAIVEILLETGIVDVESRDEEYGQTPLSWAAEGGHEAVVKTLLGTGKADVKSRDNHGRTPLSRAAGNYHEGVVQILLKTGKAGIELKDNMGRTPLSWASAKGHKAVVLMLANTPHININSEDNNGFTPLMWAGWKCHKEVFFILFRAERILRCAHIDGLCLQASKFMSMSELDKLVDAIGYVNGDDFFGLRRLFQDL